MSRPKPTFSAAAIRAAHAAANRVTPKVRIGDETLSSHNEIQDPPWQAPTDFPISDIEIFTRTRNLFNYNSFIGSVIEAQTDLCNWGLKLKWLAPPPRGQDKDALEFKIKRFCRVAWLERFISDNVPAAWASFTNGQPWVLMPEQTVYIDTLGVEVLRYAPTNLNLALIKDPAIQKRLAKGMPLVIGGEKGEYPDEGFVVYRPTGRIGRGYQRPRLYRVFSDTTEWDELQYGEKSMAIHSRMALRHHKIGHEIKSGAMAGSPRYHYNGSKDKEGVRKAFQSQSGAKDYASNFDHSIEYISPGWEHFDRRKWDSVIQRLVFWGGPIGAFMAHLAQRPDQALGMLASFRSLAEAYREDFKPFISQAVWGAMRVKVVPTWSSACFMDPRLGLEAVKFGLTAGPISPQTYNEFAGHDDDQEVARKTEAWGQVKARTPLFNPHAGQKAGDKANGRPAGTQDP